MQCKTRCFFVLLLVFVVVPSVLANDDHTGWTIDIAQQLLAEGWEEGSPEGSAQVVGYAIHFVEMKQDVARRLGFGFDLNTGETGPGLWRITEADYQIQALLDLQFHFAPNLNYELEHAVQSTSHDSWLITAADRPLSVDISSTRIPAPSAEHKEERLEIAILPKRVDGETGEIESEIKLVYETLGGTSTHVQTTTWVGPISDQPIAVVAREVNKGTKTGYQYFALFVAGALIPDEMIPHDAALIPMGTILGMQEIMEEPPERRLAELGLDARYSSGNWGILADGSFPLGQHVRLYGHAESLPDFVYMVGVEGSINSEFCLVAELGDIGDGFALRLGVRDELQLGENLRISATLLPIRFTSDGPEERFVFHWRIGAEVFLDDYSLWYQAHNDIGQVTHNLGASIFRSKPIEARFTWTWNERYGSTVAAGIRLKF